MARPKKTCSLQHTSRGDLSMAGAINVVGWGRPVEADMERPLDCFKGHSARSPAVD